jgi:uncharacterized membrane protein (TIGR02234 family)
MGLVLLAAAVALLAMRGTGRTLVGVLITGAGAALAWSVVDALTGGLDRAAEGAAGGTGDAAAEVASAWPVVVASLAALLAVLAGALVVLRGRGWPGMGRRYERTPATAAPRTDEDRAQLAWKALDRGEDPTDLPPGEQRP